MSRRRHHADVHGAVLGLVLTLACAPTVCGTPTSAKTSWKIDAHSLFKSHRDAWQLLLSRPPAPTVGALYVGSMRMPVIGQQTFMLRITGRHSARIILRGALNLDEPAIWSAANDGSGRVDIEFNEPTIDLLRRWKTRISGVSYRYEDDTCQLIIAPPLIPAIRMRLRRTDRPTW